MTPDIQVEETITITKKLYDELVESQNILDALYSHGVDNWEWYGDAMEDLEKEENER